MISATLELVDEISSSIGKEKIFVDKPTRICHRITHGPEALLHENLDYFLPDAVVKPTHTEDVQKIVRLASKYEVPLVPQGGRTSSYGAEGMRGCIAIDTATMDKILEFDEKNYRITGEAGVRVVDIIDYLEERGYMSFEYPTLNAISTIGARAAVHGYNLYENRWGSSESNIQGLEVVLPNGDVVQLGRGSSKSVKSVVGYNMMSLFIGSRGTLGVITKVTECFGEIPPKEIYGIKAFKEYKDGIEAYIDLRKPQNAGLIWRSRGAPKGYLSITVPSLIGMDWPENIAMLTDYHILGESDIVEQMEKHVKKIIEDHNGFWRSDIPSIEFLGRMHSSIEEYMGMASLGSDRIENGGMGNRIVPLDPNIPDGNLVEYHAALRKLLHEVEDGESYPALAENTTVFCPGVMLPAGIGSTKVWVLLNANWKKWDEETRKEFKDWFKKHAELVLRHGGTITATHGFLPRSMEVELIKRDLGEKEYELMKTIKRTLDPKNIMNPKIKF